MFAPAGEASCSRKSRPPFVDLDQGFALRGALTTLAAASSSGIGMPKRSARVRTASWKPIFSCSSTNLKTSPPTPQPKQWKNPRSGSTLKDGVFSP